MALNPENLAIIAPVFGSAALPAAEIDALGTKQLN